MIPIPNATWAAVPSLQICKLYVKFVKKDILGELAGKLQNVFKIKVLNSKIHMYIYVIYKCNIKIFIERKIYIYIYVIYIDVYIYIYICGNHFELFFDSI